MTNRDSLSRTFPTMVLLLFLCGLSRAAEPVFFVAPISNNTGRGEYREVADAMTDMVMVLLAENKQAKVVERKRLAAVLREQKLSLAGLVEKETLIRVGKLLKADRIVTGGIILVRDEKSRAETLTGMKNRGRR